MKPITNIMVVGIGGQGVMTAADIISQAAIMEGHDVKKTEVAGMAQRGGVVTSHVRFGEKVLSPSIPPGTADLMLAFEPAEALRWVTHVKDQATVMVNTYPQAPPVVSIGLFDYPEQPETQLQSHPIELISFDAGSLSIKLGDRRLVNSIMLGAIAKQLPFSPEVLKAALLTRFKDKGEKLLALNETAFKAGQQASQLTPRQAK
ncbi:indolepyruvate oxidoreductase subunit beta [Neptunomonas japonica]|uniref:Indolepyruvate ferredoxin oxidoreductase, beta subunit n=1 Tax=Neptunomonas japonica JAMM 1380 TaxID=1441457 RepID=A0A7R6SU53_9GAMM|nr:indolepyruvate oxidoreductase subunit beta [Neptunomonas japonica]BBB28124.1 indolepyruvate ferredoxin oxidoreductase, beta subunit [Neptunomonas japonica JAMM 1380]